MIRKAKKVAVIGSGIAGLAVAIRLAHQGFQVTVFEANATAGGKMSELNAAGYRFDKGPTVLTRPEFVEELFALCGQSANGKWSYTPVDPVFHYFFNDGTILRSHTDKAQFAAEVEANTKATAASVLSFLKQSENKHHLTEEVFLMRSLHKFKNYLNWPTLRGILNFSKVDVFRSMNAANSKQFADQKVIDMFNRYASYNGSNPYLAPATLNVIAHYEVTLGTYFSEGGIHRIVQVLQRLAEELGVRFRFNTPVHELLTEGKQVTALLTPQGNEQFDLFVSNADVYNTFTQLLPKLPAPKRSIEQPRSSSVIVFYWGMDRSFPQLGLHNMFLTNDSKLEYEHLFTKGTLYDDPTVHLTISSKMNAKDAPTGHENWAALISVPHDTGQDWDELVSASRKRVVAKLNRILQTDIAPHIVFEDTLDPRKVSSETGAAFGAVFGNSSNSMFSAFLRHPNFSSQLNNLFFCGGTAHPGPGIPLCLLSAKIASDLIHENYSPTHS